MKNLLLLFITPLVILSGCSDPYREYISENSTHVQEQKTNQFIPSHFREVINRLTDKNPEINYEFSFTTENQYLKVIDLNNDQEGVEVKYYADFTPQDYEEMIEFYSQPGKNNYYQKMQLVGLIMTRPKYQLNRFPVSSKVYTRVDRESEPLEGMNDFLRNISVKARISPNPAITLPDEWIFDAVVTPSGELVYCQLKNMIEDPENPELADQINARVFLAFRDRSNERGWRPAQVRGQRVYSRIRVEIPTDLLM